MSIRLKVALPYLLLTVVVSLIGVYVVTRLVTGTLRERLINQVLEAGRVVSDNFVRLEVQHVLTARRIAYTQGMADALLAEDRAAVRTLVEPIFGEGEIGNLILISPQGNEIIHLISDGEGAIQYVEQSIGAANLAIVAPFLKDRDAEAPPRRSLGGNRVNQDTYYYTALPVALDDEFYGVIIVGTSMQRLLPTLKAVALADIVIYAHEGQAIATTLGMGDPSALELLTISRQEYGEILVSDDFVTGENFPLNERFYMLARAPLQVGSDRIGVFAVALPQDYVLQSAEDSREWYMGLFTIVMLLVIAIGLVVSRMIIKPLYALVNTSQAIAGGDLDRRTGIRTNDEIGALASTFDDMTARLQERTLELERANAILQQIDKTKTNFIQISAHELRTPLTLIMGYSQMLEQDTKQDPELLNLAQGILEGAERMTDVVDRMLDVSRIDSDSLFLRKTSLQVDMVIGKVKKEFARAFDERKIHFETEGLTILPPVYADPELLQKVFYHLVMNAIKFTPDGGRVTVVGKNINGDSPPRVEIAVCDTGIGVDPDKSETIFEKFSQTGEVLLHSSGKTKFKGGGPGLGLAIARGIVEAHGGRIWVESPGHDEETLPGSKFIVSLPLQDGTENEP